jgi:hypothetical protein
MYEFATMISITLLGYCGVPWWTVLPAAAFLSLPTVLQLAIPAALSHDAGGREILAASGIYSFLAVVCFASGQCMALLLPGMR